MTLTSQRHFAWTVENGCIRFSDAQTGELEIISKIDHDPTNIPQLDDFIFDGSEEWVRMFYVALQDFVTMKICEMLYSAEMDQVRKSIYGQNLKYWTGVYEASLAKAKKVQNAREQRIIRLQPAAKIRSRSYDGYTDR